MGWRTADNYEAAERERHHELLASLPIRERVRLRLRQAFAIIVLVAAFLLMCAIAFGSPIEPRQIDVMDGDTIRVNDTVYRLVGFDTPEAGFRAKCERERTVGHAATQRLRQLIAGGGLDLTRIRCSCPPGTEGSQRCNFGRFCGTLTARGKDVGDILIGEKLARPYVCDSTRCPRREGWCG